MTNNIPDLYRGHLPLYDFQKKGVSFLLAHPGALLADEPGLGKTLMALAALENLGPNVVFCPASLKYQWQMEIKKFDPGTTVQVIAGIQQERKAQWESAPRFAWTICNYELLLRDYELIKRMNWFGIVCDEATRLSNPKAKTTRAMKTLHAQRRYALTGTPIQNSPMDIWSPFDWFMPKYLGNWWQFRATYCIVDTWGNVIGYKNLKQLSQKIAPFIMRRSKEEVLTELPPKTSERIEFDLTPAERRRYEGVRRLLAAEVKNLDVDERTLRIMPVKMLRLKQLTGHLRLIENDWEEGSSKLEVLKDLLAPIQDSEAKAIIFTQFAEMAKILVLELTTETRIPYLICGETTAQARQEAVAAFSSLPGPQLLIMTEAGAYGLNLQAASYVFHYDLPWSVAKLEQREDRAHRNGQQHPVTVYTLVARNTIDEYISKVLYKKSAVSADLLGDVDRLEEAGLSQGDIKKILRV